MPHHEPAIAIVTPDIVGVIKNGGIGTAYTHLARHIKAQGYRVTILYTGPYCSVSQFRMATEMYATEGITLIRCNKPKVPPPHGFLGKSLAMARAVYETLRELPEFDIIHAPEWGGHIYYCMMAKKLDLHFGATAFCITTHAPTAWSREGNVQPLTSKEDLLLVSQEKFIIENADFLVSPSRYMFDWLTMRRYALAPRSQVLPNLMPGGDGNGYKGEPTEIQELVFFGRLEKRKGLQVFIDAMDRLHERGVAKTIPVTFLGKQTTYGDGLLANIKGRWANPIKVSTDLSSSEALEYLLADRGRLAILPSLSDNSPYTVLECLTLGIPFLASSVGGIPELVHPADLDRSTTRPFSKFFASSIENAFERGILPAQLSFSLEALRDKWIELHAEMVTHAKEGHENESSSNASSNPLVSVCLIHHERPDLLAQALSSLDGQTYDNFEVILVDDGSRKPETLKYLEGVEQDFAAKGWSLIRQDNLHAGAARNTAARNAKADYLMFMDDDNLAKPDEIKQFVRCMESSGADVLTCFYDGFSSLDVPSDSNTTFRFTPLGPDASLGLVTNCYGDSNCFVRKSAFQEIGGFTEHYGVGREDHEFFARAALHGVTFHVVPEALYWYRMEQGGLSGINRYKPEGPLRVLNAYLDITPPELHGVLHLALAQNTTGYSTDHLTWRLVEGLRVLLAEKLKLEPFLLTVRRLVLKYLK